MKNTNLDKIKKIISLVFLISWCLVIFFFSNQNADLSGNSSSFVVDIINNFFRLFNSHIDILNYPYTIFIIRKLAHMFVYFVLYFFSYNCFYQYKLKNNRYLAILFCFLYAITDEFHQLFVVGRSGQALDVLIDTFGSLLAFLSLKIIVNLKDKKVKFENLVE